MKKTRRSLNDAAAEMGRKGGKATGAVKVRGSAEHYRALAVKSAEARQRAKVGCFFHEEAPRASCAHCRAAKRDWRPATSVRINGKAWFCPKCGRLRTGSGCALCGEPRPLVKVKR